MILKKKQSCFLNTLFCIGLFQACTQVYAIPVNLVATPSSGIKYPIYVACECDYSLYVDGNYVENDKTEVKSFDYLETGWNSTKRFYPVIYDESPKIIAFRGNGIAGEYAGLLNGFIMNMNDGKDYTKYQEWKCADFSKTESKAPPVDWFTFDYDDSDWAISTSFGKNYQNNSFQIFETERREINLQAEWLWTSDNSVTNVYCRKKNENVKTIPMVLTTVPVQTSAPPRVSTTIHTPTPVQTSAPTRVSTTIHTPTPVQTSVPVPVQTSVPVPVQTSVPVPVQTSAPTPVQTSAPTRVSTTIHTPTPVQTSAPTRVSTTIHTPIPVQTSAPTRVSTTIHTPTPVQTSAPAPVQISAPTRVQTSATAPVQTSAPTRVSTTIHTPTPAQTSAPTRVSTTIHTPIPVQTSAPTRVQTSAPTRVQTSAPAPVQTSAPTRVQTSAPTRVSTTIHTPIPVQTSAPVPVSTTIHTPTVVQTSAPVPVSTTIHTPTVVQTSAPAPVQISAPVPVSTTIHTPTVVQTSAPTAPMPSTLLPNTVHNIVISPHIQIVIQNIKYSQMRSNTHIHNLFRKLKLYNDEYSLYKQLTIVRLHLRQHYNALFYDIKQVLEKQNIYDSSPNLPHYIHSMYRLNKTIEKIEESINFITGNHKYILLKILNKLKTRYQQDTEQLFTLTRYTE